MKEGWEIKTLGVVATIYNGNSINAKVKEKRYTNVENGVPFIATKDIGFDNFVNYDTGVKIPFDEIDSFKIARENTVLICAEGGSAGRKVAFLNKDVCFGNKLFATYPSNDMLGKFIFYFYMSSDFKAAFKTEISGIIGGVSLAKFKQLEIPVPPLTEQKRIVSILDKAFAAIDKAKANAEKSLSNAKELFESYLNGVFENKGDDWEEKRLKDIALVFGRGKSKHRPRNWEGLFNGEYPFIQTGDVRNADKYVKTFNQTYNDVGLAQSKLWQKGTICITIAANIAESAILDFDSCFPDSIIGLQVDPLKADLDFTYYLLQYYKSELQKLGKGSAQDNINLGTFENKLFSFPISVAKQKIIVNKIDSLRLETQAIENNYSKKLSNLAELKKSILQKAFNGEI